MLRITQYIKDTIEEKPIRAFDGKILIWNLTNACNLNCTHCYAFANQLSPKMLSVEEIKTVIPKLQAAKVRMVVLSGGEPLLRRDLFTIAELCAEAGLHPTLSSNGILINKKNIERIGQLFSYVGISIDGTEEVHDQFRQKQGAWQESMAAIRLCKEYGVKVGLRTTLTSKTYQTLPDIFSLVENEGIDKLYLSHLVYSGRGKTLNYVEKEEYKNMVKLIIDKSFDYVKEGSDIDVVTGNHEVDAVLLLQEFSKRFPQLADGLHARLKTWGGNQAFSRLINIDHLGNVKPDPFSTYSPGNILEKSIEQMLADDPIMQAFNQKPRALKGKCSACNYLDICNGSSRARAFAVYDDHFAEDPSCYI